MYSRVTQLYTYMYLFFFGFFSHLGYSRVLSKFPVVYSKSLLAIYFIFLSTLFESF